MVTANTLAVVEIDADARSCAQDHGGAVHEGQVAPVAPASPFGGADFYGSGGGDAVDGHTGAAPAEEAVAEGQAPGRR